MSNHTPMSALPASAPSLAEAPPAHALPPRDIVSELHWQSVPSFAAAALDRLHGSLYASLNYLQLCEPGEAMPHTWVGYRQGEIVGVLLFRVRGRRAQVLCEVITLDQSQINAFARCVFRHCPEVAQIVFNAVQLPVPACGLPHQCFSYSENYVLMLPASLPAYIESLGKSTRQTVRGYRNRLLRDFPDFGWRAVDCRTVSASWLRDQVSTLQRFKRESMKARGKSASTDAADTERLLAMAMQCGILGSGTIGGQLRAGALCCRIGDTAVMLLSASDPALSHYRLGLLTCLWSIGDCIDHGVRRCHLLWGRYAYKHQLQAVPHPLSRMIVYPSLSGMIRQPGTVLRMCLQKYQVKLMQHVRLMHQKYPALQSVVRLCRRRLSPE